MQTCVCKGHFLLKGKESKMLRKLFFYSNVIVASIILPILGVAFTVAYTIFVIVRAIFRSVAGLIHTKKLTPKPHGT